MWIWVREPVLQCWYCVCWQWGGGGWEWMPCTTPETRGQSFALQLSKLQIQFKACSRLDVLNILNATILLLQPEYCLYYDHVEGVEMMKLTVPAWTCLQPPVPPSNIIHPANTEATLHLLTDIFWSQISLFTPGWWSDIICNVAGDTRHREQWQTVMLVAEQCHVCHVHQCPGWPSVTSRMSSNLSHSRLLMLNSSRNVDKILWWREWVWWLNMLHKQSEVDYDVI